MSHALAKQTRSRQVSTAFPRSSRPYSGCASTARLSRRPRAPPTPAAAPRPAPRRRAAAAAAPVASGWSARHAACRGRARLAAPTSSRPWSGCTSTSASEGAAEGARAGHTEWEREQRARACVRAGGRGGGARLARRVVLKLLPVARRARRAHGAWPSRRRVEHAHAHAGQARLTPSPRVDGDLAPLEVALALLLGAVFLLRCSLLVILWSSCA